MLFYRFNGNVTAQDSTRMLMLTTLVSKTEETPHSNEIIANLQSDEDIINLDMFCQGLSRFKENVVTYVAGYVVKMVKKKTHCQECREALVCEEDAAKNSSWYSLTLRKKWGALILPSHDVIQVCFETEKVLHGLLNSSKSFLSQKSKLIANIEISILKSVFLKSN